MFEKTATAATIVTTVTTVMAATAELAEIPGTRATSEKSRATSGQGICGKKPSPVGLYQVRLSSEVLPPLDPGVSKLY